MIVHGGGREIDAALAQVGIPKRQVDGLRVTDGETLNIVVSVLAGSINTKFVAAINAAGGKAVGLTGADSGVAPVEKAAPHKATSGETVDLGMVGMPISSAAAPALIETLCKAGYVPVVACIGSAKNGTLYNVNADTLAGSLAARLKAKRLVIAGATPGVLDKKNETINRLDKDRIEKLARADSVLRAHREDLLETKLGKLVASAFAREGVGLVRGNDDRLAAATNELRDLAIGRVRS